MTEARRKAQREYDKWHTRQLDQPSAAERHFIEAAHHAKQIAASRPTPKGNAEKKQR